MALFGKNANEAAYVGGTKHWADVIKNSPDSGSLLIWRMPEEDFNTNSTLIVMPGEEAVFIKGGKIEKVFDNDTYKLSTENYPFISRLRNAFTGGVSTFNCVVYFVRKTVSLQVNWGTKSPMVIWDNAIAQSVKITAFGSYNVKIKNPKLFIDKLVGNRPSFTQDDLVEYFDGRFQENIVSCIQQTLEDKATQIFMVISKLKDFSQAITPKLEEHLDKFGIELENFSIMSLKPEEEVRNAYNELMRKTQWSIAEKQAEAVGDKARMDVLGDNWAKQQASNILGTLAANPGAGGVASAGAGLGMGMAAGGAFGSMAQQMFNPMQQQAPAPAAPPPGAAAPPPAPGANDPVAALKKLKEMLDLGLIGQAEFDAKKTEIMGRM